MFSSECPETPISLRVWLPEIRNWANTGKNWLISGGSQDISAWHISGHSLHTVSLECPETPILPSFGSPGGRNWTHNFQKGIISGGGQEASACHISGRSFHTFSLRPDVWTDGRMWTNAMSPSNVVSGDNAHTFHGTQTRTGKQLVKRTKVHIMLRKNMVWTDWDYKVMKFTRHVLAKLTWLNSGHTHIQISVRNIPTCIENFVRNKLFTFQMFFLP